MYQISKRRAKSKGSSLIKREYLDDISDYENIFFVDPKWCGNYPMVFYRQLGIKIAVEALK